MSPAFPSGSVYNGLDGSRLNLAVVDDFFEFDVHLSYDRHVVASDEVHAEGIHCHLLASVHSLVAVLDYDVGFLIE